MAGNYASRARKLNSIMRRVSNLLEELRALERESPAPSAQELEEMQRRGEYTFDAFFLGYIGCLDFHLDEVVSAIWSWLRRFRPSKYPRHLEFLTENFVEHVKRAVESRAGEAGPAPEIHDEAN